SIPFEIKYLGRDEKEHFAWTTSWGISWRLIGAVIMVHGDDKGLILPPRIAPIQAVIVPIFYNDEEREEALRKGRELLEELKANGIRAFMDDRTQYTPGWKFNEWELKGVPLRIEIGPRNLREGTITLSRRDTGKKEDIEDSEALKRVGELLEEIQRSLFERAKALLESMTHVARDFSELKSIIEGRGGFVKACWCGSPECESKIKEQTGATIRAIPFEKEPPFSGCVWCGKEARGPVYFARAY
ncbi:MAG: His/Gly/Thr/Pro-type tRNA ligase C-terminal domain-containing protein, partial [Candidatus Bathyarchaeia archaeon]